MTPGPCPGFFRLLQRRWPALALAGAVAGLSTPAQQAADPKFQWPLIKGEYPELRGLTSMFGESRSERFHSGLDIAGLGDPIRPLAAGKYLFVRLRGDDPFRPEPGPGNAIVLDHGNGYWSGYFHLRDFETPPRRSGEVQKNSTIGFAGNTGHSGGPHLHFFLAADHGARMLNPLRYLPAATDQNAPILGQLAIVTPNGMTLVSSGRQERIRLTKRYPILITIIDPGFEEYTRRGVYQLQWQLNDQARASLRFDELQLTDGGWRLSGRELFDRVFQHNLYNLGELEWKEGVNRLVVQARDYAGNQSQAEFEVLVDKQY